MGHCRHNGAALRVVHRPSSVASSRHGDTIEELGNPFLSHLLRIPRSIKSEHGQALSPAIGTRKRSVATARARSSLSNQPSSDAGRWSDSTGVANLPRTAVQNLLCAKSCHHHRRQRTSVRSLTPSRSSSRYRWLAVPPW